MSRVIGKAIWNSVLITGSALATAVIGMLTLFALTHLFTVEEFGAFVSSQAKVTLWLLLVDLGLYNGLIGTLSALRSEHGAVTRLERAVLWRALGLRLAGSLIGLVLIGAAAAWQAEFDFSRESFWREIAYTPFLFGYACQQTLISYLAYRGQQDVSVAGHLTGVFLSALAAVICAAMGYGVGTVLFVHSLSGLVTTAALLWRMRTNPKEKSESAKAFAPWNLLLANSWAYALIFASTTVWQRLDQITAAHLFGLAQGGEYGLAARLVGIPIIVIVSVSVALFPDFQRTGWDAPEKLNLYVGLSLKWLLRYGLFLTLAVLGGVASVIVIFFPKFWAALYLLPWFVPGIWAYWMFNFANNGLLGFREYKKSVAAHVGAAVVYLGAIQLLPHWLGLRGVALAYSLFCVSLFLFTYALLNRSARWRANGIASRFNSEEIALLGQLKAKMIGRFR